MKISICNMSSGPLALPGPLNLMLRQGEQKTLTMTTSAWADLQKNQAFIRLQRQRALSMRDAEVSSDVVVKSKPPTPVNAAPVKPVDVPKTPKVRPLPQVEKATAEEIAAILAPPSAEKATSADLEDLLSPPALIKKIMPPNASVEELEAIISDEKDAAQDGVDEDEGTALLVSSAPVSAPTGVKKGPKKDKKEAKKVRRSKGTATTATPEVDKPSE